MAVIPEFTRKEQLIRDCKDRIKEVQEKGTRPTIVLVLEALVYLLEKSE